MHKHNESGFGHVVLFLLVVVILAAIGFAGYKVMSANKDTKDHSYNTDSKDEQSGGVAAFELRNWPVKIGPYDPATKLAGDVYMDKAELTGAWNDIEQRPVAEFAWERVGAKSGQSFRNASIDFLTRPGAPLYAVSDGYVVNVKEQNENGRKDYEIIVTPESGSTHRYQLGYDHLIKPTVKAGDKITAGQVLGETGPYGSDKPYSFVEIQLNYYADTKNQQNAEGRCPSSFMAAASKAKMTAEITDLMKAYEGLLGSSSLYNEAGNPAPGCQADKSAV